MDSKILTVYFLLGFGFFSGAEVNIEDNIVAKIDREGRTYTAKLSSCKLKSDLLIKGPPGPTGPAGSPGVMGLPGLQGNKGENGELGTPGKEGKPGPRGYQGTDGFPGERGDPGLNGQTGPKGDRGSIGPSGSPGLDGTCLQVCKVEEESSKAGRVQADGEIKLGSKENPADSLCHIVQSSKVEDKLKGVVWVNSNDTFQVRCEELTYRTCIIPEPTPEKSYIEENAINYSNATQSFWLSEKGYNFEKFYHVTMKQLRWLQRQSVQVVQKIRFHCKNSLVVEQTESSLLLHGWNDMTIGPHPTDSNPLAYSTPPEEHNCKQDAPKTEWRHTDIIIKSKTSGKLPVIDFRIRDVRDEEQSFYLELLELCFG